MGFLEGVGLLSLKHIKRSDMELIFRVAQEMEPVARRRSRVDLLEDKVMGTLFFQASTRTRLSFESAMSRLGGGVLGFANPEYTRAGDYWQESLADTVRVIEGYADILVIRHTIDGAPAEAARIASVPVFNAGDGYNEHPTQALTDLYTIMREKGTIDGLTVAIASDLNIRAIHSLLLGLGRYDVRIFLVSTPDNTLSDDWKGTLSELGIGFEERSSLEEVVDQADVFYLHPVRTPSYNVDRHEPKPEREETPLTYKLTRAKLDRAKPGAIVLHPLPRTDELPTEIDPTCAARYFEQAFYGVPVRMALLAMSVGRRL